MVIVVLLLNIEDESVSFLLMFILYIKFNLLVRLLKSVIV